MDYNQEEWLLSDKLSPELEELKAQVEGYLAASRAYLETQRRTVTDQLYGVGKLLEAVV